MKMVFQSPAMIGLITLAVMVSACSPTHFSPVPNSANQTSSLPDAGDPVVTPAPSASPTVNPSPTPGVDLSPTPMPSPIVVASPTPAPSATPTPVATPSPTPVATPALSATPIATPRPSATPIASPTPVSTPVVIATPTPAPVSFSESFAQDQSANKIDILIVNDNSASMEVEQSKMSTRFSSFISALQDVDYQIGMTTTDIDSVNFGLDGKLLTWTGTKIKVLNSMVPNLETVFLHSIQRTETLNCEYKYLGCPSGNEQPLKATIRAMDHQFDANKGFFRDGVPLVVVVLSDEDEESNGPSYATTPEEVVKHFELTFGPSKRLAVYGLIIQVGDKACRKMQLDQTSDRTSAYYGTHVTQLAAMTGGKTFSICDPDFGGNLSVISQEARQLVAGFTLAHTPIAGTVVVTMSPNVNIAFTVVGNKVIFAKAPPAGTHIDIRYSYQP